MPTKVTETGILSNSNKTLTWTNNFYVGSSSLVPFGTYNCYFNNVSVYSEAL